MAKPATKSDISRLVGKFWLGLTVILLVGAGLARLGYNFATKQVHDQLVQEKIKFPPKGSPGLDPKEFPGLQQYAGQAVDSGPKAKAYANEFIWVHMMKASGGQTYAEVSSASLANPKDQKLAALKNTLFQGDMLRSSLLTAYAFSVFGMIAGLSTIGAIIAAAVTLLFALASFARARR